MTHEEENIAAVEGEGAQAKLDDVVFEKAEREVMSFLPEMEELELLALIKELGLVVPQEKTGRRDLFRFVLADLMDREATDGDGGKDNYIKVHGVLRQLSLMRPPNVGEGNDDAKDPNVMVDQKEHVANHLGGTPPVNSGGHVNIFSNVDGLNFGIKPSSTPVLSYRDDKNDKDVGRRHPLKAASLYHLKECKIRGTIGDPGEKDKLGYYGLISEIKERQAEGYDDNRVVGAVINAVTPGNVFKRRLEMRRNLESTIPLSTLMSMLQTHYQEKSSNTIFHDLSEAVQGHDETATKFCNRLIVMRDEALSRSIEEGFSLDANYLRKRFLKSFATGLRNGNIRNELREILKADPQDDDLLKSIAEAARGEKERADKMAQLKSGNLSVDVSVIQREKNDFQVSKRDAYAAKMEDMQLRHQNELAVLRAEICEIKNFVKPGLSNLSANPAKPSPVTNGGPPPLVQDNSNFGMGAPNAAIPPLMPAALASQQQHQYVIPQMRNQPVNNPPQFGSNGQYNLPPLNRPRANGRFQGCVNCVAQNVRCTHCWFCCASDHKMECCPVRQRAHARSQANGPPLVGTGSSPGNC